MQEQKISKSQTKIVDELTVSDDFNTGLTGVPVFTDGHIAKYKPTRYGVVSCLWQQHE